MSYTIHLIKKEDKYFVQKVKGFVPSNSEGIVSLSVNPEDYPYLRSREVVLEGSFPEQTIKEIYVDEDAKAAGEIVKLAQQRNSKLALLRSIRDQKLLECDNIVRDLALGLRSDQVPIREYRQALKDITDDYKYVSDSNKGKATLDAFADDLSDFTWPTKP